MQQSVPEGPHPIRGNQALCEELYPIGRIHTSKIYGGWDSMLEQGKRVRRKVRQNTMN